MSARLVRTPKAPKKLPEVMTAEQANTLLDGVAAGKLERPHPGARPRDLRIAVRLRHSRQRTGRAQPGRYRPLRGLAARARQGTQGAAGAAAAARPPRRWSAILASAPWCARSARSSSIIAAARLTDARHQPASSSCTPRISRATRPCIRTASATLTPRTCSPMAPTCAPFRNCWATRASPPRRSTRRFRSRT